MDPKPTNTDLITHIKNWNTQNVTDMRNLFLDYSDFNDDNSLWDTQNVTNMSSMFSGATSFYACQSLHEAMIGSIVVS